MSLVFLKFLNKTWNFIKHFVVFYKFIFYVHARPSRPKLLPDKRNIRLVDSSSIWEILLELDFLWGYPMSKALKLLKFLIYSSKE